MWVIKGLIFIFAIITELLVSGFILWVFLMIKKTQGGRWITLLLFFYAITFPVSWLSGAYVTDWIVRHMDDPPNFGHAFGGFLSVGFVTCLL